MLDNVRWLPYIWLVSRIGLVFWDASPIFNNSLEPIRKTTLRLGGLKHAIIDINAISDIITVMASMMIRNLNDETKRLLKAKAAQKGHSLEEEVRLTLDKAVNPASRKTGVGTAINKMFKEVGGSDLQVFPRDMNSPPPDFADW
jgi:antitoxin FitA